MAGGRAAKSLFSTKCRKRGWPWKKPKDKDKMDMWQAEQRGIGVIF